MRQNCEVGVAGGGNMEQYYDVKKELQCYILLFSKNPPLLNKVLIAEIPTTQTVTHSHNSKRQMQFPQSTKNPLQTINKTTVNKTILKPRLKVYSSIP